MTVSKTIGCNRDDSGFFFTVRLCAWSSSFLINGKLKTPKLTDEQKAYLKTKAAARITAFGGVGVVPDNHIADIAKNSI